MRNSPTYQVLALGEFLWDLLPSGAVLGGAPANFAVRLQSLGVTVGMVSKVGVDELGERALRELEEKKVSIALIQRDAKHPTGTVPVTLSSTGNASYVITQNVAYDFVEYTEELHQAAKEASLICFGTLVQRTPKTRDTIYKVLDAATNAQKLLDINLRKDCFSFETISSSLTRADILKLNDDEMRVVGEMCALPCANEDEFCTAVANKYGIQICLITRADKGVFAWSNSGERINLPGIKVTVTDTIGSGDAFTAGFASKLLAGASLKECCEFGNKLGALVATTKGGMSPVDVALIA